MKRGSQSANLEAKAAKATNSRNTRSRELEVVGLAEEVKPPQELSPA
jgi:hypothetical protein